MSINATSWYLCHFYVISCVEFISQKQDFQQESYTYIHLYSLNIEIYDFSRHKKFSQIWILKDMKKVAEKRGTLKDIYFILEFCDSIAQFLDYMDG
jgi:uncharacterized protein Veg